MNLPSLNLMTVTKELDAGGLVCPEPVMLLHKSLRKMAEGSLLRLKATDPSTRRDVRDFCRYLGHHLLKTEEKNGVLSYLIRKKEAEAATAEVQEKERRVSRPEEEAGGGRGTKSTKEERMASRPEEEAGGGRGTKSTKEERMASRPEEEAGEASSAVAVFAAGCFWHVQDLFAKMQGVKEALAGYTGGSTENPSYEEVCAGETGHAEAVRIDYDPQRVSYDDLLTAFWQCHDPTQWNRQGADIGKQYRSAVFWTTEEQQRRAEGAKKRLVAARTFSAPVVTQIVPASKFYAAEDYHQMYLRKRKRR